MLIFLNGEEFLSEAIESVVGQEGFDDWELLLCDDGSTDSSPAIAKAWAAADERVHYLDHPDHENRGMSATRNLGLRHARGDYVSFLDCDDAWQPRRLATLVPMMDARPDIGATYGRSLWWYSWTDKPSSEGVDHLNDLGVPAGTVFRAPELIRHIRRNDARVVPVTCAVFVRRELLVAVGGFEEEFRTVFEDHVYFSKIGVHMDVLVHDACLERYRRHPDSCTAAGTYHPDLLNPVEQRFLEWLEDYLERNGLAGDEAWVDTRRSLAPYRHPRSVRLLANSRWRLAARRRRRLLVQRLVTEPVYVRVKRLLFRRRPAPAVAAVLAEPLARVDLATYRSAGGA